MSTKLKRSYFMQVIGGLISFAKGMAITLRYFFSKTVTLQYPKKRDEISPRTRGRIAFVIDPETGKSKCNACNICVVTCPDACITLVRDKDEAGKNRMVDFSIDNGLCCYCALCVEACPSNALETVPEYEYAVYKPADLVYHTDRLLARQTEPPYKR